MKKNLWAVGLAMVLIIAMAGCSGNGGGSGPAAVEAARIEGNIYNPPMAMNRIGTFFAKVFGGTEAQAIALTPMNATQLADISNRQLISYTASVINQTTQDLSGLQWAFLVDDASRDTPHYSTCIITVPSFSDPTGSSSWSVWEIQPDSGQTPPNGCTGYYPSNWANFCAPVADFYDCTKPAWSINDSPADTGFHEIMSGPVSTIAPGKSFDTWGGYGSDTINIKNNHYAVFRVLDEKQQIINEKWYIFNVIP